MVKIVKYENSKHETRYKFRLYAGVDEKTGKKRYVKRSNFLSEEEAQKEVTNITYQINKGEFFKQDSNIKFNELLNLWLDLYKGTVKPSTYATTTRILNKHVLPLFKDYFVKKITLVDCQKAVNKWFKEYPKQLNRYVFYTTRILDYAVKLEIIDKNPFKDVTKPRVKKDASNFTNFYSKAELNQFLYCCKNNGNFKIYAFFRLLAYSGMRKGEALALKWKDIDFNKNMISINKTVTMVENNKLVIQPPKTLSSKRNLYMDSKTMSVLKEWKNNQAHIYYMNGKSALEDRLVFSNKSGAILHPTRPNNWMHQLSKKYGLKYISCHGFRHTHASILFQAGATIKEVQDRLGHADAKTTLNIYTHVTQKEQNETVIKFANYLN
ncbi:MAG TPA: site-specific integrase [Candidatus Ligilactobacillus excrementigallinarum]|uniref:Site-specific integrase n=1 Tax=Candidatus Ligilactobacillus excrementigallinarum TaxID=2838641 RepID=A0A9D1UVT9_9LACO|nr:site-specific integrase [Candidatus Ligilactobacillus excrementigallinarum]